MSQATSSKDQEKASEGVQGSSGQPSNEGPGRRRWKHRMVKAITATLAVLAVIAAPLYVWQRQRRKSKAKAGDTGNDSDGSVRIPLKEVVRFKEKQWFVEELEASREGDPNAMLRLAKMYLHGQGCDKSVTMAQEWLRKARYLGVYCTLEELYAGEDWEAAKATAAAAARRALKQQEMGQAQGPRVGYRPGSAQSV